MPFVNNRTKPVFCQAAGAGLLKPRAGEVPTDRSHLARAEQAPLLGGQTTAVWEGVRQRRADWGNLRRAWGGVQRATRMAFPAVSLTPHGGAGGCVFPPGLLASLSALHTWAPLFLAWPGESCRFCAPLAFGCWRKHLLLGGRAPLAHFHHAGFTPPMQASHPPQRVNEILLIKQSSQRNAFPHRNQALAGLALWSLVPPPGSTARPTPAQQTKIQKRQVFTTL